ncbi:hypothetical protein AYK24_02510 [Thermoplasmatales archaeon SG8-52-4]|nr:MAG: hypothetical protein AYK24_02510 [Thermoplasmatales archaeon SG8-52-4]
MKKTILILGIIFLLFGISLTPVSSTLSIQTTNFNKNENNIQYLSIQCQPIVKKIYNKSLEPLSFAGIVITGGDFDEYHPSVAGSPGGEYYAMAEYTEDDVVWHPMLYGSTDGITWNPIVEFLYNAEFTDMDQNDYGTYGTFGTNDGTIVLIQAEICDGWIWNFGPSFSFSKNRIACYTFEGPNGDPGEWNWGAITCVGYNGYRSNDIDGCPFIIYPSSGLIVDWLYGDTAGCENVGSAMDLATNMHYAVYDRDTGTGNYDILIRKDNFGVWQNNSGFWKHPLVKTLKIEDTANLKFPSVSADNNNVIIACQNDDNVIVYYSTNGLSSITEVLVETDASYPEVEIATDGTAVITYIKDGTLYMRTSDDRGATWSDAYVVSDSQINLNYRAANLDEYLGNIIGVWEDIRDVNIDIYYDEIYLEHICPPLPPVITGPNGGKKGLSYTFNFNSIDPNGDDVRYHIDWGDENSYITEYEPQGTNVPVAHTWANDGAFTITAYTQNIFGITGPESTKAFKVTRSKALQNTIFFYLFEKFPILEKLFLNRFGL